MSSKDTILSNIRRNTLEVFERPDLSALLHEAVTYGDKIEQFCQVMQQVGGRAVLLREGESVDQLIRRQYPQAQRVASTVEHIDTAYGRQAVTCGTFHPDSVERSADLNGTDLAIIKGRLGVCENGAVWIQQDVEQRTIYFIADASVILLDRRLLVNNMHEAYERIDTGDYGYGVFISGPSKTADIEQALVLGAHGAADVTVVLV